MIQVFLWVFVVKPKKMFWAEFSFCFYGSMQKRSTNPAFGFLKVKKFTWVSEFYFECFYLTCQQYKVTVDTLREYTLPSALN